LITSDSNVYRIHVHDFAGHPFQVELSNKLAKLGFDVLHSYFSHSQEPKGVFADTEDSGNISFKKITFRQKYENKSLIKRLIFEFKLAFQLISLNLRYRPDVTVFANTPLISATLMLLINRRSRYILWHQDVISSAFRMKLLDKTKSPTKLAALMSTFIVQLEKLIVNRSHGIVCIAPSFLDYYQAWGVDLSKVRVIRNWAPLAQINYSPSNYENENLKLIYAGTLGMKHNPSLLVNLLNRALLEGVSCQMLVISEGEGANILRSASSQNSRLQVINYVPLDRLEQHLQDANIALVLLESDASLFSVPSKTYSYLAAGKPVIAFAPESNDASKSILEAGGKVFSPDEVGITEAISFFSSISLESLRLDELSARKYAESNFDSNIKSQQFAEIIHNVLDHN